jgi:manganese/zinc/iron transport system substrate-binding protein
MLNRRHFIQSFAALAVLPRAACASTSTRIVATTGMIADAARVLAADVDVRALMGPGTDPHMYRQTRADIAALARADLVLWHGLYLEAQMEAFFTDLARKTAVVAVAEALPRDQLLSHTAYADRYDPHVWMDPVLWSGVIDAVAEALSATLPGQATDIVSRSVAYKSDCAALHAYSSAVLGTVPEAARILVTAHDAFGYFGRAYGFSVEGIQGISTESEAGLARVGELVDLLVAKRIPAVFVESSVSDRSVRALVEGAAAKGHTVAIGGQLFSDAMGPEGSYEGTWLGMIDHNVTLIANALGGSAPTGGRLGKLRAAA